MSDADDLVEELKTRLGATEDPWPRLRYLLERETEITIGIGRSPATDDTGKPRTLWVISGEYPGGAILAASDSLDAALTEALNSAGL